MTTVFLAADGDDGRTGEYVSAPRKTLAGFKFPVEGDLQIYVEAGHAIGDITPPAGLDSVTVSSYRPRPGGKNVWLPKVRSPWARNQWATVGAVTTTCPTHLYHLVTGDVDVTAKGEAGVGDEGDTLALVTLQHVHVKGDLDLSDCEYPGSAPVNLTVDGKTLVRRVKGGHIHFHDGDIGELDITDADCRIITGTDCKETGRPKDSVKYRKLTGKAKATAALMFMGTGQAKGALAKGEKPEWQKSKPAEPKGKVG